MSEEKLIKTIKDMLWHGEDLIAVVTIDNGYKFVYNNHIVVIQNDTLEN